MMKINLLQKRLNRLEELFPKVIEEIFKSNYDENDSDLEFKNLLEYKRIKTDILLDLKDENVFSIENKYLKQLREKLQRLSIYGDPNFPVDVLEEMDRQSRFRILQLLGPELSSKKEDELLDEFHSWYSGYDYTWNKLHTNLLIIKAGVFPSSLTRFVNEIRECLAFNRYLAAAALLRTTLEIAVEDLCKINHLDDLSDASHWNEKSTFWDNMIRKEKVESLDKISLDRVTLQYQIDLLCLIDKFKPLQNECHEVRKVTNQLIHGKLTLGKPEAMTLTHRTFQLIHELYEVN